jgi:hypothetical protein
MPAAGPQTTDSPSTGRTVAVFRPCRQGGITFVEGDIDGRADVVIALVGAVNLVVTRLMCCRPILVQRSDRAHRQGPQMG